MAAGRIVVPPYFPARNRNGNLLSGALLYVYANETTTKVTVYTDEALTVPQANPVEANASGQFPPVWAEAGTEATPTLYSVSVTTADGESPGNAFNFDNYRPSVDFETAAVALAEAAATAAEGFADDAEIARDESVVAAGLSEAALAEIIAFAGAAPDAPSIVNKLNRNGDNASPGLLSAIGAVSLTALAGAAGAGLVGAAQSGTGATTENQLTTFRRIVYADQFATIQQAITACPAEGAVLHLPRAGTITLTSTTLTAGKNNLTIEGNGCKITGGATRIAGGFFNVSGSVGVTFKNVRWDCNGSALPVYTNVDYASGITTYNTPIVANGTGGGAAVWSNITLQNCVFDNLYTNYLWCFIGQNVSVTNCQFNAAPTNQTFAGTPGAQQYTALYFQTVAGNINVDGNQFIGGATTNPALPFNAVFASSCNGQGQVSNNRFAYCGRNNVGNHRLATVDLYGDFDNWIVCDNTSTNTLAGFMRISSGRGCVVHDNLIYVHPNADTGEYLIGAFGNTVFSGRGIEDIYIHNNLFDDPSNRHNFTVQVASYDWGRPSRRIRVEGNSFVGGKTSVACVGPFQDMRVVNNAFQGDVQPIHIFPGVGILSVYGTEANSFYDQFFFCGNTFVNTNAASGKGGYISGLSSIATTAYVGYFEISNNILRSASASGIGFTIQLASSTLSNTRTVIRGNTISGFSYAFYFRRQGEVVYENNRLTGWVTGPTVADAPSYTTLLASENRYAAGVLRGASTLVAGTVTVATTEARTGDIISLSRVTSGGTTGAALVRGTITQGTSFVITAVDTAGATVATDTSTVAWHIHHTL